MLFDFGASHSFVATSYVKDLGLKVKTLEEPLHVSSPLGTRVNVDQICRGCELEISRILLTIDLRVMDMLEFDVILGMDWLMYTESSLTVIVGGLPPTHWMMFMLCFIGIIMMLYPKTCITLYGMGS